VDIRFIIFYIIFDTGGSKCPSMNINATRAVIVLRYWFCAVMMKRYAAPNAVMAGQSGS
jgi:hypothetical protein